MKSFEYGDSEIGSREIFFIGPSMVIGVGILSMPRDLASKTNVFDGWMSIVIAGIVAILLTWMTAKLASRFPGQTYYHYTQSIVTKPIALFLTICITLHFIVIAAYEVRVISHVARLYLFERTPMEVISLVFLLVVIYAVAGSSVGILRINMMFLPIILVTVIAVQLLNIGMFESKNLTPLFVTSPMDILKGAKATYASLGGFSVLLFYIALVNKPEKAPRAAALGMVIPLVLYVTIYFFIIGVFSESTKQIIYPTIEIAKEIEAPGSFFERFDSVFFTIWIMTIFNSASMAFDVAIIAFKSLIPKIKKIHLILTLTPIIYLTAVLPQNYIQLTKLGAFDGKLEIIFTLFITPSLLIIALLRGVKGEKKKAMSDSHNQ